MNAMAREEVMVGKWEGFICSLGGGDRGSSWTELS